MSSLQAYGTKQKIASPDEEHKGLCLHCNESVLSAQLRGFRMKEGTKRYFQVHDHCMPAKVCVCYVCNQKIANKDLDRDAKGPRHASCFAGQAATGGHATETMEYSDQE